MPSPSVEAPATLSGKELTHFIVKTYKEAKEFTTLCRRHYQRTPLNNTRQTVTCIECLLRHTKHPNFTMHMEYDGERLAL